MGIEFIKPLVLILGTSALVIYILGKLKISSVVGFLISGIILGPFVLGLIKNPKEIELFAEIGVILLMFTLGLEFSLKNLYALKKQIFIAGGLQVAFTMLLVYLLFHLLMEKPINESVFFGTLVALSSTAIVMKIILDRAELNTVHGRNVMGILIFQDLIAVWFVLFIPVLSQSQSSFGHIAFTLLKSVLVVITVLVVARWVIPIIFDEIAKTRNRELFIISVILFSLSTAYLTNEMGLSLALGAFLAGIIISESEYAAQAIADIAPLKESFTGMFFISVGMLVNMPFFLSNIVFILAFILIVLLVKAISGTLATLISSKSLRISLLSGFYLSQIGEFSFVLALAGRSAGLLDDYFYQLFLSTSVVTMFFTPFIIMATPSLSEAMLNYFSKKSFVRLKAQKEKMGKQSDKTQYNHTIIIGFGLNGSNLAKVLKSSGLSYVIVELNLETVKKYKNKEPIYFGDASNAEILHKVGIKDANALVIAISDPFSTRKIVKLARLENKKLYIIARTRYVKEVDELIKLGANEVIPEEFETSLEISSRVLNHYGIPKNVIMEMIESIRENCYRVLRTVLLPSQNLFKNYDVLKSIETISLLLKKNSNWIGKSIGSLEIRQRTGATVIAVNRNGEHITNPTADFVFNENDIVLLIGNKSELNKAYRYFYGNQI